MKRYLIILLFCLPIVLKAQNKEPLYIADSVKITKSQLNAINPNDISDVAILKSPADIARYGAAGVNGVVVLTTKKFAIASYQEKFSSFSDDLESYLTSHGKDDSQFIYIVDDVTIERNNSQPYKLNSIAKDKIESVIFVQDQPEGSKILAKVVIKTKK
jgi:outer membrane receptor protein involved in Fe transport